MKEALKEKLMEVMFAGKTVDVWKGKVGDEDVEVKATVFPVGVQHVQQFSEKVVGALGVLNKTAVSINAGDEAVAASVVQSLLPYALENLMDVIDRCVRFNVPGMSISDLPHYVFPTIIEAWIVESFGTEEKWRPWVAALDRVMTRFGLEKMDWKKIFSEMRSKDASSQVTN